MDSLDNPVEATLPTGQRVTAYPVGQSEAVTLPRFLPGLKAASTALSYYPPQLNELYFDHGRRGARGEVGLSGATLSFLGTIVADRDRWLTGPPGFPETWTI